MSQTVPVGLTALEPVPLDEICAAQRQIAGAVLYSPLVPLNVPDAPADIWLKLENLQPVGSFKLRGALNAMRSGRKDLSQAVWTASAGNMAQAVAWCARCIGVECTALVPEDAPATKVDAVARLGGKIVRVPFADYQQVQITHAYPGMNGVLIHPFADRAVMAGNGTIALEILEQLPDVNAIVVPYGGGGLSCGIASAVRALAPRVKVFASEVETGAPLAPSLAAGHPVQVDYAPSFVSGIGAPYVFPEMWSLASRLLDGSFVTRLTEVAAAIRLVAERNRVVAEGAAATAVAAALSGQAGGGKIVCVLSGGNIDGDKLGKILQGHA